MKRLRLFQDFVRHHQGWAGEIEFARPLGELIDEKNPTKKHFLIEHSIAQLSPTIYLDLQEVGIETGIMQRALRPNEQIELERDLVADYLDIQQNQNTFELLMTGFNRASDYTKLSDREHSASLLSAYLDCLDSSGSGFHI